MRTRTTYLCDATIFAANDPRERVRKSGRVGADERARLVHVGAQLEELKMSTICLVGPQMVMYWNFLALDQHQSTTLAKEVKARLRALATSARGSHDASTRLQSLVENLDVRYKATIVVPLIPNQCCEKLSLFLAGGPNLSV